MRRLSQISAGRLLRPTTASVPRRALFAPRPASIASHAAAAQPRVRANLVLRVVARHQAAGRSPLNEPRAH